MSRASKAILWHNSEFPPEERHKYCPAKADTWCRWQKDVFDHGYSEYIPRYKGLPKSIHQAILPTFEFLSSSDFLEGCKNCYTQNQNESLHHVIWSYVPKSQRHSSAEVSLGVNLGITAFNTGFKLTMCGVLDKLNISLSNRAKMLMANIDTKRIYRSNYSTQDHIKS